MQMQINCYCCLFFHAKHYGRGVIIPRESWVDLLAVLQCVCGVSWTIISHGCLWGQSTEKVSCYLFFALTPRCLGSSVCSFYMCYLRSRREAMNSMNQRELLLVRVGSVPQDNWLTLLVTETKLQKKRRYFVCFTEDTLKRSEQINGEAYLSLIFTRKRNAVLKFKSRAVASNILDLHAWPSRKSFYFEVVLNSCNLLT